MYIKFGTYWPGKQVGEYSDSKGYSSTNYENMCEKIAKIYSGQGAYSLQNCPRRWRQCNVKPC